MRCSLRMMMAGVLILAMGLGTSAWGDVTFEWVTVGNPGNAPDPQTSSAVPCIGSVGYVYQIAKHEVTNDQYAEFLNAVATTDTHSLYNANMGSNARGGITRSGADGIFTYSVKANMGNKPVNYVSFVDAMRFVNWLHHGQPAGPQDASTTEDGVYTISSDGVSETRSDDARYFIPTENEWYKAAYHQPAADGGDANDYWRFPTGVNDNYPIWALATATGDIANPGANVANYDLRADWNGLNGNLTTVGSAGPLSESFYGTCDQGGNVAEWNQTVKDDMFRSFRGGAWDDDRMFLESMAVGIATPWAEYVNLGFRVARPAPTGLADLDGDDDVDLFDFAKFQHQFTGPR